tara:strand:+ start:143 stop:616 length:474 start_codon:yes stop_codon:yes gene_type:complete
MKQQILSNAKSTLISLGLIFLIAGCSARNDVPNIERLAQEVNKGVMCPVCPGESIDQSQHPLAVQMRDIVSEKISQGLTKSDINDFFVERYGPRVLLEPPSDGVHVVIWIFPAIFFLIALAILYVTMRIMVGHNRTNNPIMIKDKDTPRLADGETGT